MITQPQKITESIKQALNRPKEFVPLHEPYFSGNELKYVQECIESTFVSSVGNFVDRFEKELADYTGAKHVVAVVNGTAALHMSLLLSGVEYGDEVLLPSLTFVAVANAISYCGAIPHFVDSNERTLGIDPEALREYLNRISEQSNGICVNKISKNPIRVIIPVHIFGHPCDIHELLEVAKDFNLVLIEDASESLGSRYHGQHTGTFGLLGVFSFNGNKIITTGGGGAILTDDSKIAQSAKHLTKTAKLPHNWEYVHDKVGYNYRMPNINAALGCAQLEKLQYLIDSKKQLYKSYENAFKSFPNIKIFQEPKSCRSNYWLQTLVLEGSAQDLMESVLDHTNSNGLMTRPVWKNLHSLIPFRNYPRSPLPVAESLEKRLINLPSSSGLIESIKKN